MNFGRIAPWAFFVNHRGGFGCASFGTIETRLVMTFSLVISL